MSNPFVLRGEIDELQSKLKTKQSKLTSLEAGCSHKWSETEYAPIHQEAYHIPSDIEMGIYLGVDTCVSGVDVPAKTIRRWKRVCLNCGKVHFTERTKKVYGNSIAPGCSCEQEVPDFG